MKKALVAILGIFIAASCMAEGWQVSVTTNSTVIAPATGNPRQNADGSYSNMYTSAAWAAGALSQGAYVTSGGVTYWLAAGGTATNAPTVKWGVQTLDGITYVAINKRVKRQSLVISLDTPSETVYINDSATASATSGTLLHSGEPKAEYDYYSGFVTAISTNGNILVNVRCHQE